MGKFDKLAKYLGAKLNTADDVLKHVDTAELATSLKGNERADYLKALNEIYGSQEKRIKAMGYSFKDYYHGTEHKGKIDAFRESGTKRGDVAKYGNGLYVTDSPGYADQYAGHGEGQIFPLKIKEDGVKRFNPADRELANEILKPLGLDEETSGKVKLLRASEEGLHLLEKKLGKNKWREHFDKSGHRVELPDDSIYVRKPNEVRSVHAAFDPRFKDSPLLMAGALAGQSPVDMNPLEDIKKGLGYYEQAKEVISKPLARQLNLSGNQDDERTFNNILKTIIDPGNLVQGPVGGGISALQLLTPEDDKMKINALDKLIGER